MEENKREIKDRNSKIFTSNANQCSCETFIQLCIDVEDNLCSLIQSTEAAINQLYSYIENNKKQREVESFNYKDTLYDESYVLIHIMEATNFSAGYGSLNSYVYVEVRFENSTDTFRTKEMPIMNSKVLWNEPLKM